MNDDRRRFLGCLAACLLAALPAAAGSAAAMAAAGDLPGVDTEGLSAEQKGILSAWAKDALCYCGCPHTVAQCMREHATCKHAKRMATLAARIVRAGANRAELEKRLEAYYASFDRRARLDVSRFGPPLGNASAPLSIVEFSDFTCPYCQLVRPGLEAFVQAHASRVKLFYKPFPIESHPGALECAQAGEWARDQGRFWAMHDAVFEHPGSHTVDDLADLARGLGLGPANLREAIADKRYVAKIRESQAEARVAGLKGTPTLFLEGRNLVLMDYSDDGLEQTLEDEEEWQAHHGWSRD